MVPVERPKQFVDSVPPISENLTRRSLVKRGAGHRHRRPGNHSEPFVCSGRTFVSGFSYGPRWQSDSATLTIAMDGSPSDIDPHSAYNFRSVPATSGTYEGLIGPKDDTTDELVGLIAESWTPNEDQGVWTFTLLDVVRFQDGAPRDAGEVLLNYERLFSFGPGPFCVITRFDSDCKTQITAPDAKTVVFTCAKPEPPLPTALASTYAMPIVNAAKMKEHEVDGYWGHFWAQTNAEGTGTGAYEIVSFEPGQQLVMERNEG